jgi:hypothetical protein
MGRVREILDEAGDYVTTVCAACGHDVYDFSDYGCEECCPGMTEALFASEPSCRVCGCTQSQACASGCIWAQPDLCSQCVSVPREEGGAS